MLFVALTLAGCGGITFENDGRVEGTYTLRSINGQPLPFAPNDRSVPISVGSGVLTLSSGGAWSETLAGTVVESGQPVSRCAVATGDS